ncbi:MAG TPA: type 1 glutamine amidotransferase domain-containing protein [Ignavibacteriaceae bacterium]
MSANIDVFNSEKRKRILIIAANPSVSKQTGWPIGFWAAELTHPYFEFTEKGYEVEIVSPDGGKLELDGFSDPKHESGYSAHDLISLGFLSSPNHSKLLENTKSISQVKIEEYDALFLAGGQSPMYTFVDNTKLHKFVSDFYEAGKVVAIVCHATCVLLKAKTKDGKLLVDGKTWTGFANSEEQFADNFVGMKIQPFWIEEEAKKLPNTNFIVNGMFKPFAVRDGRLITGQQQYSGGAAAKLVIETLGV